MEERVKAIEAQVRPLLESEIPETRLLGYHSLTGAIGVKVGHVFWKCIYDYHQGGEFGNLRVVKCTVEEIEVCDRMIRYEYSCWIGGFVLRILRVGNEDVYADLSRGYEAAVDEYKSRIESMRKTIDREIAQRTAMIKDMEDYLAGLAPVPLI